MSETTMDTIVQEESSVKGPVKKAAPAPKEAPPVRKRTVDDTGKTGTTAKSIPKPRPAARQSRDEEVQQPQAAHHGSQSSTVFYIHAVTLFFARIINVLLNFYNTLFGLNTTERAKIYRNVSNHYLKKGMRQKAMESLKEWVRLEPSNAEAHYQLALALIQDGKGKQAIIVLNKVLKNNPHHSDALYRKSRLLIKQKQYAEAYESLLDLQELEPDNAEVLYLLGMTCNRLDKTDEAVTAMKKAVELDPEECRYYQHLGFILEQAGEHQEAAKCFARVMELDAQEDDEDDLGY